ncbi:putative lipase [Aspergillus novofumigatus IBT 16806]|uniref:Putative lipase n=1 Tax=Aspergillus novofumigatus (strain IBT 16806) TaxID=1392255 RepID=A0A2I1CEG1_ASPN1|nr:putative lipase [Aspergillus novofumigatus IBT 16806]PKX95988.1 putative lipase [Aspergillus novofumigatus IBT 16806]
MGYTPYFPLVLLLGLLCVLVAEAVPLLPSEDPFYTPNDDSWSELPPGTIVNSREVTIASLVPGFPSKAKAFQLLYVTRDVHEQPAHTVTTIVVPQKPKFDRLLSFQIAYDSPDINCSPSYGIQFGVDGAAATWNRNQLSYVLPYLQQGPVLNIPDYEGSNAAFTVGPQSAYQTLDSIRAALNSEHLTGLSPEAKTIMFGYSGGGYATEWASEFHHSYSPELEIAGAAIGGPPTNITKSYLSVNGGAASALNAWAMLGVMNAFPDLKAYMLDHLLPEYREAFLGPLKRCSPRSGDGNDPPPLNNMNISSFFDNGHQFLYEFKDILDEIGVMGRHGIPKFPLYIYKGTNDDIAPTIEDTTALVRKYCEAGTNVRFLPYSGLDHTTALIFGMLPGWGWMTNIFNGIEPRGCRRNDLSPDVDVGEGAILEYLLSGQEIFQSAHLDELK